MSKKAAQQPAETSEVILYLKQISNEKKIDDQLNDRLTEIITNFTIRFRDL